ncbi:hypothetical protein Tco_1189468, partial [Tanacetum coccineum]
SPKKLPNIVLARETFIKSFKTSNNSVKSSKTAINRFFFKDSEKHTRNLLYFGYCYNMSRSTSTRTIYIVAEYDRTDNLIDVDDTATTPAPVEFEPAEQEESDPFEQEESEPAEQEESDHEASSHKTATPPTTATYYRCTPIDSPGPRPLMVRSPHILPGTPVGFASGLNQFEKNMIRELTQVANTARYLLDLQEDTMSGVWGNIHRMDTQMTWMQCDYREARAERRNAWCFNTTC